MGTSLSDRHLCTTGHGEAIQLDVESPSRTSGSCLESRHGDGCDLGIHPLLRLSSDEHDASGIYWDALGTPKGNLVETAFSRRGYRDVVCHEEDPRAVCCSA